MLCCKRKILHSQCGYFLRRHLSNVQSDSKSHYALLLIPATAFYLGTWQVKRLAWKKELIRDLESRTTSSPVALPSDILNPEKMNEMEYKPVIVSGKFDHSKEIYLGPRSKYSAKNSSEGGLLSLKPESGYHIVTPFILNNGERILINRGWVPIKLKDPSTRASGQINEEIKISGFVRKGKKRPQFSPKIKVDSLNWHYCDIGSFSTILNTSPILIDADMASSVEGGPIGGQTRVSVRNEHLQYIITWYSLSAVTFYMFYKFKAKPSF